MEKLISHSAKLLFGYMFYEMYNFYKFTQYQSIIKKAINIDLSFEKIEDSILNEDVLIATSINNISINQNYKSYFYLKSLIEGYDEGKNILKVLNYIFKLDLTKLIV